MALIRKFEQRELQRYSRHDEASAAYYLLENDGRKLFQLNTFGRDTREQPEKVSQSIQLDEESATVLVNILSQHFGLK